MRSHVLMASCSRLAAFGRAGAEKSEIEHAFATTPHKIWMCRLDMRCIWTASWSTLAMLFRLRELRQSAVAPDPFGKTAAADPWDGYPRGGHYAVVAPVARASAKMRYAIVSRRLCHSKYVSRLGARGRCTPLVFALHGCPGDPLALPLQHQVPLEGCDGAQHGQHQLPGRAPCVDPLAARMNERTSVLVISSVSAVSLAVIAAFRVLMHLGWL
jgi:hypothetical protein